jgi:hypothetical protein
MDLVLLACDGTDLPDPDRTFPSIVAASPQ